MELRDATIPVEGSGAGSLGGLAAILGKLGGGALGAGGRTSSSSTASNVVNLSTNPVIYNQQGSGSPNVSPYIDGSVTGSPNIGATATATGSDYLPGRATTSPSYLTGARASYNGLDPALQNDNTGTIALAGGALLLFWLLNE